MRSRSLVVIAVAGAGCGAPMVVDGDPQADALAALAADTGTPWTVRYHSDLHTPAFLDGRTAPIARQPAHAAKAARDFLTRWRTLFRMVAPDDELEHEATDTDELGMWHARFVQKQAGVPVWGGELTAHFASDGALLRIHGRYLPLARIDLQPAATVDEAAAAARSAALADHPGADPATVTVGAPSLTVDPGPTPLTGDPTARLAWRVEVAIDDPQAVARVGVFVDAVSGQPYRSDQLLDEISGSGAGVFGDRQALEVTAHKTRFSLENQAAGKQRTYSAAGGAALPGRIVVSARRDAWDDAAPGAGAAVDAHAFVTATYAYFADAHGREGWNGKAQGMRAVVHYGHAENRAFWDGRELVFGDGDGTHFAPLAGALDLVAHEYTHAVVESAVHLGHSDEPGALGEAIADLFGCFVERAVRDTSDWRIGAAVYQPGRHAALRDLAEPHRTANPAHLSERVATADDRGGIHVNSTVASHAAFLFTDGGVNQVSGIAVTGVGQRAAEKIWYRALRYLHPGSGFADAADATVAAARDLYGDGATRDAVAQAWRAVGVLP